MNSKVHHDFINLYMSARLYKFLMIFFYQLPVKEVQMFLKLHTLKVIKIIFNFRSHSLMVSETFDLQL